MGAQVADLVAQRLRLRGAGSRLRLERVDLAPQSSDLPPRVGIGGFELLHASHQRLVTRDLVGGRQQLRFDLAGQDEAGRQGHDRQEGDAGGVAG